MVYLRINKFHGVSTFVSLQNEYVIGKFQQRKHKCIQIQITKSHE